MFLETFKVIKNKDQVEKHSTEEVTRLQVRCSFATLEPTKKSLLIQGWNYQINDRLGVTGCRNTKHILRQVMWRNHAHPECFWVNHEQQRCDTLNIVIFFLRNNTVMEGVWSDNAQTSVVDIAPFGKKVRNADKGRLFLNLGHV